MPPPPPPLPPPVGHPSTSYDSFSVVNSHHHHHLPSHHHHQQQEFARSSQNTAAYGIYGEHRYHPYYKTGATVSAFDELQGTVTTTASSRTNMPVQAITSGGGFLRCDKCDYQTIHSEHLVHHLNVAHQDMVPLNLNMQQPFGVRFANGPPLNGGAEPQAEILDLDSHKVHVYQPPNGEDSPDDEHRDVNVDPWHRHHQSRHQPQLQPATTHLSSSAQQRQNGGTPDPRGTTPLPSPDFGSVSTTTDHVESSTRSPYYDHSAAANAHISSTENANSVNGASCTVSTGGRGSSKGGKSTNGAWKSNEARRPKTYNCSACNKWFTSSGHLKRHYNTTLHKNAVKQSGVPDPATLPVSHHHHPQKDPTYATPGRHQTKGSASGAVAVASAPTTPIAESADSLATVANVKLEPVTFISHNSSSHVSTTMSNQQQQQQPQPQQQPTTPTHQPSPNGGGTFLQQRRHSPNLMAGPSENLGGLTQLQHHPLRHHHHRNQLTTYPMHQSPADSIRSPSPNTTALQQQQPPLPLLPHPPHSNHLSFPPPPPIFGPTPTIPPSHSMQFFPHMSTKVYPNFQSPHVSTTHQVTTTSSLLTGSNLTDVLTNNPDAECADSKLPSFACLPKNTWNQVLHLDHMLGTLETTIVGESNVGGRFTSNKEMEAMLQRTMTSTTTTTTTAATAATPANAFNQLHNKGEPLELAQSDNDENANDEALPPRKELKVRCHSQQQPPLSPPPQSSTPEEESVTSSTNPVHEKSRFGGSHHLHHHRHLHHHLNEKEDQGGDEDYSASKNVVVSATTVDNDVIKQPFSCETCQKRFNKVCYLTQHNKSFHSGVKPFKCSRCGKRFPDSDLYAAHWAKHSGDKPYKCDACPKAFNHKTDLRRHACLHSDTRPFNCDLCGKGFIRKDHMLKHRETHKNRKNGSSAAAIFCTQGVLPARGSRLKRLKVVQ